MRSRNVSIRTPVVLFDALTTRADRIGYQTLTAYFLGLARYDLMVQGPHSITLPWSVLALEKQDAIDDKLAKLTAEGKGERGQLLTRLIERAGSADSKAIAAAIHSMEAAETPPAATP
jgi:hypothetical protein